MSLALGACAARPPSAPVSAAACAALPPDPELGALYGRPPIEVTPIHRYPAPESYDLEGATIVIASGVHEETLEHALACHAARHDVAAIATTPSVDPLRPSKGVARVRVERRGDSLVVIITAETHEVAHEIFERARLLASSRV
ncbi:MAG: hypothetical protein U0270_03160 [Labilithrix sp.]